MRFPKVCYICHMKIDGEAPPSQGNVFRPAFAHSDGRVAARCENANAELQERLGSASHRSGSGISAHFGGLGGGRGAPRIHGISHFGGGPQRFDQGAHRNRKSVSHLAIQHGDLEWESRVLAARIACRIRSCGWRPGDERLDVGSR